MNRNYAIGVAADRARFLTRGQGIGWAALGAHPTEVFAEGYFWTASGRNPGDGRWAVPPSVCVRKDEKMKMMQLMKWDRPESKLDCQYGKQVSYEVYLREEKARISSATGRIAEVRSGKYGTIALFVNRIVGVEDHPVYGQIGHE